VFIAFEMNENAANRKLFPGVIDLLDFSKLFPFPVFPKDSFCAMCCQMSVKDKVS